MNVFIFTEGGTNFGFGHISRCTSIYEEFFSRGATPTFVLYGDAELLDKNVLYKNWHSLSCLKNIDIKNSICIVDSYIATLEIYNFIKENCKVLLCIDDFNRLDYPSNFILNPSISQDLSYYENTKKEILLTGNKFVILRKEFSEKIQKKEINDIKEVLITLGGTDIRNITVKIYKLVKQLLPYTKINIVMGKNNTNLNFVKDSLLKDDNLYINLNAQSMKEVMLKSDIVISASGQTTFELVRLGIPFIPIEIIENQKNILDYYYNHNFIKHKIIWNDDNFNDLLIDSINTIKDKTNRENLQEKYYNLIDGQGAKRVVEKLLQEGGFMCYNLEIFKATVEHCDLLFQWANEEETRKNAFSTEKIVYENHVNWLNKKLKSPNTEILIFKHFDDYVGQLRLDFEGDFATISYSIDKNQRKKGFGKAIVFETIKYLKENQKKIKLVALVKYDNIPSQKIFESLGFEKFDDINNLKYIKNL